MINFIDEYMRDINSYEDIDGFDEQKILIKSISKVLPLIMKNELTEKQYKCLKMFYVENKTQTQIATALHLSQPTVCRHISVGKDITNKILQYCYYSVKQANEQWMTLF